MPSEYLSVKERTTTEKIIEKSRFITNSCHISGEEEAKKFISEIKAEFSDATHNCYAFVADNIGNFLRFSDDGEPQGTAGMPMLEVIRSNRLFETAVVVTRYFGGIKLGAGGLVRAYSGCVAENLLAAKKVSYENCAESLYKVDYPSVDAALRFFSENGGALKDAEYSVGATFTVAVRKKFEETFNNSIVNNLNGRVKIEKLKEYFFPFEI